MGDIGARAGSSPRWWLVVGAWWRRLTLVAVIGAVLVVPAAASGAGQSFPPTPGGGGLKAVQCWAAGHCLAVGGSARGVLVDRLSGTRWSTVAAPNPGGGTITQLGPTLKGLSCLGSRWCLAVGSNGCGGPLAERWDGRRWSLVNVDLPACQSDSFTDVSCASRSFCMAVAVDQYPESEVVRWDGTAWLGYGEPVLTGGSINSFYSVSCAAQLGCAEAGSDVGGGNSDVGWWNGHEWGLDQLNDLGNGFRAQSEMTSVSCPSLRFCMAVGSRFAGDGSDSTGAAIAWHGSGWGQEAYPSPLKDAVGVSCASRTHCVAVNASPTSVATFNGSGWRTTASAFHAYPNAISCPVIGWCMIVGVVLNAKTGGPVTPAAASVP